MKTKLIPILTEKSMKDAASGKYSFWVGRDLTKHKIKVLIEKIFSVEVAEVHTINMKEIVKTTLRRRKRVIKPRKKAIVSLKNKQKIDLFEESKK